MIQRFESEAEARAIPDAHIWHDLGNPEPWVALTGEDRPVAEQPVAECSPWQIRQYLNGIGKRQMVETWVANSGDQNIKDGWEFTTKFLSDHPLVVGVCAMLGLDPYEAISAASRLT